MVPTIAVGQFERHFTSNVGVDISPITSNQVEIQTDTGNPANVEAAMAILEEIERRVEGNSNVTDLISVLPDNDGKVTTLSGAELHEGYSRKHILRKVGIR